MLSNHLVGSSPRPLRAPRRRMLLGFLAGGVFGGGLVRLGLPGRRPPPSRPDPDWADLARMLDRIETRSPKELLPYGPQLLRLAFKFRDVQSLALGFAKLARAARDLQGEDREETLQVVWSGLRTLGRTDLLERLEAGRQFPSLHPAPRMKD